MKTLTSPSSAVLAGESTGDPATFRPERLVRMSRRRYGRAGALRLAPARRRSVGPVLSLSSEPQVELDVVDEKSQETNHSRTVHVKFQIQRECSFGDEFLLVGDDPMLGLWDPDNGIPLTWSDDHVWTAEMDMPIGKTIQYKFILKESAGTISWQPGPDRIFQSWETINVITVSEEWEDAENQKLIEDDGFTSPNAEPAVKSEVPAVDEKLTHPKDDPVSNMSYGSAVADDKSNPAEKSMSGTPEDLGFTSSIPSQEKPLASVADNIGNAAKESAESMGNAKKGSEANEPTDNFGSQKKDIAGKELNDNVGNPKKDLVPKEPNKTLGDTDKRTNPAKMETTDDTDKRPSPAKMETIDDTDQRSSAAKMETTDDTDQRPSPAKMETMATPNKDKVTGKDVPAQSSRVAEVKNTSTGANKSHTTRGAAPVPVPGLSLESSKVARTKEAAQIQREESNSVDASDGPDDTTSFNPPELDMKEESYGEREESETILKQWPLWAKDKELDEEDEVNSEPINGVSGNDPKWGLRTLQKLLVSLGLA